MRTAAYVLALNRIGQAVEALGTSRFFNGKDAWWPDGGHRILGHGSQKGQLEVSPMAQKHGLVDQREAAS